MEMSNTRFLELVLILLSFINVISAIQDCNAGPCYPEATEITSSFIVNASSTCGLDGRETFCDPAKTDVCNAVCDNSNPALRHPAFYVNDDPRLNTYWKSKNVIKPVTLQIDFGRTFMLYFTSVRFFNVKQLPSAMYFETSTDHGKTFQPKGYFSTNCLHFFNRSSTTNNNAEEMTVQCFKIDEQNNQDGEVNYRPIPALKTNTLAEVLASDQLSSFFLMTNMRLVLDSYANEKVNVSTASEELKRSFSFKVKDWDITAACVCNGQASKCNTTHCFCERNTAGRDCEKCLPLFNNKPYESRKACEDCGCNSHALSCSYNNATKYGVCNDCMHNTVGDKCENCKVEFYRNSAVAMNNSNTCLPCGCDLNGVPNVWNRTHCHPTTGQCLCKTRVEGRACDACKPTFWNLTESNSLGCEECNCSTTGSINGSQHCDAANGGQCPCKANVDGRTCSKCKDGYYDLTGNNPQGCLACNCNAAGSAGVSCNSTGGCTCRPKYSGLKCEHLEPGYFGAYVASLLAEAEDGMLSPPQEMKLDHKMLNVGGKGNLFVGVPLSESNNVTHPNRLTLQLTIPRTAQYTVVLRYMTHNDWFYLKITLNLQTLFSPFSCNGGAKVVQNVPHVYRENVTSSKEAAIFASNVCLLKGDYTVVFEVQPGSSGGVENATIVVDSIVLLPTVSSYPLYNFVSTEVQQNTTFYYQQAASFKSWSQQSAYGCQALSGYYGYLFEAGQDCACNVTGSNNPDVCNQCGGQCACKSNVIGRTCDKCRPDYYNFTSGYGCEDCACNLKGSQRSSCHATTGKCDCKANVVNRQCSSCKTNYYNLNSGNGCLPCNCKSEYSTSLQCHADSGICSCKPGVGGTKCSECKDTFYNLTSSGCVACNCNDDGSHNGTCDKTNGQCPCREHSTGRTCDTCPEGFYGLGSPYPKGCLQCQCSNKTSNCSTAQGWREAEVASKLNGLTDPLKLDGWLLKDGSGQSIVGGVKFELNTKPFEGIDKFPQGFIVTKDSVKEQYFSAPDRFVKEGRFAYLYTLSFKMQQDNHTTPESSEKGDIILKGKGFNQLIVYKFLSPPVSERFNQYTIKFIESDWHVGTTQGRRPTNTEMVAVLSTLEYIYIRAKWSTANNIKTRITAINMKVSNKTTEGKTAFNVESCNCPAEYQGQFCERCAPGYTRATPNGGTYVKCVPCQCNGHSNTCDGESGVCSDCQHNTTGNNCELCADGLYGNATIGTANDCKPCPCPGGPLTTNQFSPTCFLDNDGQPTCNNCTEGHIGRRCDQCKDGYYGMPTNPNGKCQKCNCNGNVDTSVTGNCNTTTGECSNCGFNTTGFNCEKCAPYYYGNALNRTCSSCKCNQLGTQKNVPCNHKTGQCACLPLVTGMSCDRCMKDAFNFSSGVGCSHCNCYLNGANNTQCNETTGICECKINVRGDKCDTCVAGFYGVSLSPPCQECNCSSNYTSNNTVCDVTTGQCQCKVSRGDAKYGGRQCDRCSDRSVGEPDNCRQCSDGGKCFDKWYDLIKVESDKVNSLEHNVTEMLKAFGGSSVTVDSINKTIQELNANLTKADEVFQGAQYNTKDKQDQINKIKAAINDLDRRLNLSSSIIREAQMYLSSTVDSFNGTVVVMKTDNSGPLINVHGEVVTADWTTLSAMVVTYRSEINGLNESGHELFKNISQNYEAVRLANETAANAANQVAKAMKQLDSVSSQRKIVEDRLDDKFQSELQNNSNVLDQIKQYTEEIGMLIQAALDFGNNATSTVTEAKKTSKLANSTAHQRKTEAEKALADAESALKSANASRDNAMSAQVLAAQFKDNATAVLEDSQTALKNVTKGINIIATAINQSRDSKEIADKVAGMTLPVNLETIQGLTNEIKAIKVDETLINQTYEGAQKGLKQAQDVEKVSQEAIAVAEKTLKEVQNIEKSIEKSKDLRNETVQLQKQTDKNVEQINNITQSINEKFGNASLIGQETLELINKTISNVDENLKCFNESKKMAEDAVVRAKHAYNVSLAAEKLNETVSANITRLTEQINPLAAVAEANYTSALSAYNDTVQLYKDVNQAEDLLSEYIIQRKEMEALKSETILLEKELDELAKDFEEEVNKYSKCQIPK